MKSKARLMGHSIHRMLNVFPLALFVSSLIFDVIYRVTYNQIFDRVAFYNIAGGLVMGAVAAVFGYIDYSAIPARTRAKRLGTFHGFGNLAVMLFFSFSFLIRLTAGNAPAPVFAILASAVGVLALLVSGWQGGELVSRLGVSVHPGANLNAPSSLTDRPAHMPAVGVPVTGDGEEGTVTTPEEDTRPPVS